MFKYILAVCYTAACLCAATNTVAFAQTAIRCQGRTAWPSPIAGFALLRRRLPLHRPPRHRILEKRRCSSWGCASPFGGPIATISPPSSPLRPESIIQSAVFMTSRLCSMTDHAVALVDQLVQHLQELREARRESAGPSSARPEYRASPVERRDSSLASFTRCASARERHRLLADGHVSRARRASRVSSSRGSRRRLEERSRLLDRHVEHVGDGLLPLYRTSSVSRS